MIVITRTFYLESASILFDNNRRSQFRAGRGGATRFEYKKKKKEEKERENTAVNTPLSDLQLHVRTTARLPNLPNCFFLWEQLCSWPGCGPLPARFREQRFEKNDWDVIAFGNLFESVFAREIYGGETVMLHFFFFLRILPRISIELLHRIISLSEFNKFNKGRICRSRKKIRRSVYEYVIESRSCWNRATDLRSILRNGFKYDERDTAWHEIVTGITSYLYREPVLLYDYAACRVAAISEEKGKRENIFTENPETS